MRLAQLIDTLNWGGAQRLLMLLVQQLTPLGVEVTVISLHPDPDEAIPAELTRLGARVLESPVDRLVDPAGFQRLTSLLRRERFDLLQSHLFIANTLGSLAGRLTGTPTVTFVHNSHYNMSALKQSAETWAMRWGARRIIGCGQTVAEVTAKRVGRPVLALPNAVMPQPDLEPAARQALRLEVTGDPTRPLVLSVGRLSPAKGFPDLLEAFARVHAAQPRAALVIAGGGDLEDELRARVTALGLDGHAFLLGLRNDAPALMAAADVYVNASHWEGLPVTVLEAMGAGRPVIATAVSDTPRVLIPGAGVLVPPRQPAQLAAALERLLEQPETWAAMGQAGQQHVRAVYGPAQWRRRLLQTYAEVTPAARPALEKAGA